MLLCLLLVRLISQVTPVARKAPVAVCGRLDSAPISGFGRIAASEQALGVKIQNFVLDSNKGEMSIRRGGDVVLRNL